MELSWLSIVAIVLIAKYYFLTRTPLYLSTKVIIDIHSE